VVTTFIFAKLLTEIGAKEIHSIRMQMAGSIHSTWHVTQA
jgi:hypothetical protein